MNRDEAQTPTEAGWRPDAPPQHILVNPTRQCVYQCRHCDRKIDRAAPDLPILVASRALSEIAERFGPRWVTLAGGEPLLYGGTVDLVAHCKETGHGVNVMTNGALLTDKTAAALGHWKLDQYDLSLDGPREVHDRLRRAGAYDAAIASLDRMRRFAPGVPIGITCVIHRQNVSVLADFVRFCLDQPGVTLVNLQAFISHRADERDRDWYHRHALWPDDLDLLGAQLDAVAEMTKTEPRINQTPEQLAMMKAYFADPVRFVFDRCLSWRQILILQNNGDVCYCPHLPPFGNLHRQSFSEIWDSPAHATFHERAAACRAVCHYVVNCGFDPESLAQADLSALL